MGVPPHPWDLRKCGVCGCRWPVVAGVGGVLPGVCAGAVPGRWSKTQRAAAAAEYETIEAELAKERELERKRHQNDPQWSPVELPESAKGDARDKAAEKFDVSGKLVSDAKTCTP